MFSEIPKKKSTSSYWISIVPRKRLPETKKEGKWVVFLRRNYCGIRKNEYTNLLNKIQLIVEKNGLIGALARRKNLEVINFFTSADRDEIWRVKQIIMQELKVKESDLAWKADFETDDDWSTNKGKLWFLDEFLFNLDMKDTLLRQGRVVKAEAIQKKQLIHYFQGFISVCWRKK